MTFVVYFILFYLFIIPSGGKNLSEKRNPASIPREGIIGLHLLSNFFTLHKMQISGVIGDVSVVFPSAGGIRSSELRHCHASIDSKNSISAGFFRVSFLFPLFFSVISLNLVKLKASMGKVMKPCFDSTTLVFIFSSCIIFQQFELYILRVVCLIC